MRKGFAYHDNKCSYGYMVLCDDCKSNAPSHVDVSKHIGYPPALGKEMPCEMCKRKVVLSHDMESE